MMFQIHKYLIGKVNTILFKFPYKEPYFPDRAEFVRSSHPRQSRIGRRHQKTQTTQIQRTER